MEGFGSREDVEKTARKQNLRFILQHPVRVVATADAAAIADRVGRSAEATECEERHTRAKIKGKAMTKLSC